MYLDKILGSTTRINILAELVSKPERKFVERELADEIGMAASGVNLQIRGLVECGVVRMEKAGKTSLYCVNKEHFLFPALEKLFRDLNDVYREMAAKIAEYVAGKHRVSAVILIGSVKRRKVSQDYVKGPSDLDIVVIGKNQKRIQDDLEEYGLFEEYGVNCYPIVMDEEEYMEKLKRGDPFILEVQVEGEVLYGKKPKRIG